MTRKEYYAQNKVMWRKYYAERRKRAPLYAAWRSMLIRCGYIKGAKPHEKKRYIERNILVCQQWIESYEAFESWALAHGWKRGLQIDRINNDGNYEPSNCRFVTTRQNCENRSNTMQVLYKGVKMLLPSAYTLACCKLPYKLVSLRIGRGWETERAFTEKRRITKNGH